MNDTGFDSNVDPSEVGQFDALASEWWDESGPLRTLHHLNPVRADYIVQRTGGLRGLDVVDVGCGGGILTEALARAGANVLGIDLSRAALDAARLHRYESQLAPNYEHIGAEALAERGPGAYDVVTCLELWNTSLTPLRPSRHAQPWSSRAATFSSRRFRARQRPMRSPSSVLNTWHGYCR